MTLDNLSKNKKLVLGIILDLIGMITFIDIIWAPISGLIMTKMYAGRKGKVAGVFSFIEEILPGFDIIPSFTIMWFYTYVFSKKPKVIEVR
ncbi:hypothetical protein [Gelidibacter japonicus]|jgi:hypothetical protein|uniref:hypothetical protein n=1 Tax=Gelidibacter japonicus TaxID=1962232 RepID=UPI0013D2DB62|nr:hypothetical protein [Gelidibacter japonicus]MCL8005961.1 hypothetical protein [Gelidibacter japonicus]